MDENTKANHIRNRNAEVESANEAYERAMAELEALTGRTLHTSDSSSDNSHVEETPAEASYEPEPGSASETAVEPAPSDETADVIDAVPLDTDGSEPASEEEPSVPDDAAPSVPDDAAPSAPDDAAENSGDDPSDAGSDEEAAGTDGPEAAVDDDKTDGDEEPDPATSDPAEKKKAGKKKKRKKKRRGISKGFIYLIVLLECMILVIALVVFSHSVSINRNDKLAYHDPSQVDEISCYDGTLNVNNVSVTVPVEKNVTYKKSYTWSPDDKEYPTIPHAVTAGYYNDEGTPLYDISLYRESYTKTADIPRGKDAANWFSDWKSVSDENSTQEAKNIGNIHGFLVSSKEEIEEGDTGATYAGTTYYFTSQDENGLSVYILEGILYDAESLEAYNVVMHNAMESLTINQQAA